MRGKGFGFFWVLFFVLNYSTGDNVNGYGCIPCRTVFCAGIKTFFGKTFQRQRGNALPAGSRLLASLLKPNGKAHSSLLSCKALFLNGGEWERGKKERDLKKKSAYPYILWWQENLILCCLCKLCCKNILLEFSFSVFQGNSSALLVGTSPGLSIQLQWSVAADKDSTGCR